MMHNQPLSSLDNLPPITLDEATLAAKNLSQKTGLNWGVSKNKKGNFFIYINDLEDSFLLNKLKQNQIEFIPFIHSDGKIALEASYIDSLEIRAMARGNFKFPKFKESQITEVLQDLKARTGFQWFESENHIMLLHTINGNDSFDEVRQFRELLKNAGINPLPEVDGRNNKKDGIIHLYIDFNPLRVEALRNTFETQKQLKGDTKLVQSEIILYKAKNGELAVKFPDQETTQAFLKKIGGFAAFPSNDQFNAGKSCPAWYPENPTVLYFPAYVAKNGEFAAAFPTTYDMKKAFYETIIQSLSKDVTPVINDMNSKALYFCDQRILEAGKSIVIPMPNNIRVQLSNMRQP